MADPSADLWVPPGPGLAAGLRIPAAELHERFSRSGGPGGQSVNTADSRVELSLDLLGCSALTPSQRARAITTLAGRLVEGRLLVVAASEHRSQLRNRAAARERLAALLRAALAPPPPPRRPTKPSASAQRRRLEQKRRRGQVKAQRRDTGDWS